MTPILERDDKSRKLLKDYQAAATQTQRTKLLNERIAHDQQLRREQHGPARDLQIDD